MLLNICSKIRTVDLNRKDYLAYPKICFLTYLELDLQVFVFLPITHLFLLLLLLLRVLQFIQISLNLSQISLRLRICTLIVITFLLELSYFLFGFLSSSDIGT